MTVNSQQNILGKTEIIRIVKHHEVMHAKRIVYKKKHFNICLYLKRETIIKHGIIQYWMML